MEKVRLEEICTTTTSNLTLKELDKNNGIYPVYGASGLIKYIDFYNQDKEYIGIVKDGAGIGRVMLLPKNSSILGTMQYIFPKENIDIKYLYFNLIKINLKKYYSGSTIPHIYFKDYKKEKIKLYSFEKQKKITKILENISNTIEKKKQKLQEYELLSKCLFSFATKRARTLLLSEVADITMGQSPDSKYYNTLKEGLPFFQGKTEFGENYIKEIKYYCSCPLKIAKENSILMSVRAPVGTVNISKMKCCIGRGLAAILPREIEMLYLFFALKNLEKEIERKGVGSTFKAITKKDIEKIEIPIIEIKDQVDFVNRILKIEKSKFEIQKSIEETQKLFDSLMEKYFG